MSLRELKRELLHKEFYTRYDLPGDIAPKPGDLIRVNYGIGLYHGYVIVSVRQQGSVYSFTCRSRREGDGQGGFYLNGYHLVDGRMIALNPQKPDTAGWYSNGGGRDGDGFDEILIEERAAQGELF